jgi:hypothetical protein
VRFLPSQFRALFESIRIELDSLRETIEKSFAALGEQHAKDRESRRQERETEQEMFLSNLQSEEAKQAIFESAQRRRHRQNLTPQWITAVATTLAFIAAAIYAREAHEQLKTMNVTYKEMQRQTAAAQCAAKAAQEQTSLMHQQLVGTMGAVVKETLNLNFGDKSPQFSVQDYLQNDGHVTARKIQGTITWLEISLPSGKQIGKAHNYDFYKDVPVDLVSDPSKKLPWERTIGISEIERQKFSNAESSIMLKSDFTYLNGFDTTPQHVSSCRILLFLRIGLAQDGLISNTSIPCDQLAQSYDSIMKQAEAYKQKKGMKTN